MGALKHRTCIVQCSILNACHDALVQELVTQCGIPRATRFSEKSLWRRCRHLEGLNKISGEEQRTRSRTGHGILWKAFGVLDAYKLGHDLPKEVAEGLSEEEGLRHIVHI